MYAVIKTGGKQYKVAEGDKLAVEKLEGKVGDKITLDQVLAVGGDKPQIGAPLIKGTAVNAEIIAQEKGDKVIVFKKKRRHNYRRKLGHRQLLTTLKITSIGSGATKKAAPKADEKADSKPAEAKKEAKAAKPDAKKAPAKKATAEKKPAAKKPAAKKTTAKKD